MKLKSHMFPAVLAVAGMLLSSCDSTKPVNPGDDNPQVKDIAAPSLTSPVFGASINVYNPTTITFKWGWTGSGEPEFTLMIDKSGTDFSSPLLSFTTSEKAYTVSAGDVTRIYAQLMSSSAEVSLAWVVKASLDGSTAVSNPRTFKLVSDEHPAAPDVLHGPSYRNPVIGIGEVPLPDPDVIRGDDGWFYCTGTENLSFPNAVNLAIYKSHDLVCWQYVGHAFETHPALTSVDKNIWAPSLNKVGDKYVLYYSQPPVTGETGKHRTGVAVADTPAGPYKNLGVIIDPAEQGVEFCIDAYLYQEDGRNYLLWGSNRPISIIELTADATAIKDKGTQKRTAIAGSGQYLYEGTVLHKRNGYYYLICSCGKYAKNGTYKLVCSRSKNLLGPYVNRAGENMKNGQHEFILLGDSEALPDGTPAMSDNERYFTSPGHCSKIITDDSGVDWILYHSRVAEKGNDNRYLLLDRIEWSEDGWPYVPGLRPSRTAEFGPYFK